MIAISYLFLLIFSMIALHSPTRSMDNTSQGLIIILVLHGIFCAYLHLYFYSSGVYYMYSQSSGGASGPYKQSTIRHSLPSFSAQVTLMLHDTIR